MKRAALYHRVSTADQNPEIARAELHQVVRQRELELVLNVEETASGANQNRPGLVEVMNAAMRGRIDIVVVWKLDRFGRSCLNLLSQLEQLERAGVAFLAVTQGIELRPGSDASSRFFLTILAAVAELERGMMSERTRLGIQAARDRGEQIGRPRSELEVPVEQLVELRARGMSWRAAAETVGVEEWQARRAVARSKGDK